MWKRLGQPLSGKQMAATVGVLLLAAGAVYGLYHGVAFLWHRHMLDRAIPSALAGLRTQRDALSSAIESYKAQFGYYPPLYTIPGHSRGVLNPLCYELVGTRFDAKAGEFRIPVTKDALTVDDAQKYFNARSFSNCLGFPASPTNFLSNRPLAFGPLTREVDAFGIAVSYTEVTAERFWDDFEFSTWRYVTNPAEHNPGKFDLWVEVNVAGKHFTIGNWAQVQ
jgi:hypothetical protein